jgi:uncharacterized protein
VDPRVAGFEWDEANRGKCQAHGVSLAAIESLFHNPIAVVPDPNRSQAETRFKAIGKTNEGRYVLIVFTLRRRDVHSAHQRPLHARQGGQIL